MATFEKDPMTGAYIVKSGDTLSKIASSQGRTLQELLASNPQYASNPNLIRPGQTVNFGANTQPPAPRSYADLTSSTLAPQSPSMPYLPGVSPEPTPTSNPTTSFTKALIDILKTAQGTNQTGQAKLMKQSQDIKGQGLADSARNFNNPNLAPSSGTSLGLSAQNEFDPSTLSIENQQKLATTNLGNITDIIDRTQKSYDTEQDRINSVAQDAADRAYKEAVLAETIRSNKAGERIAGQKANANTGVGPGENPQLYSGLSSQTATAVRGQVSAFKTEQSVQNFSTVQEGRNFAGSLDNKSTNPADDQALIYSLAKALDPGSVVREGEYATAQKYAQSWINAYGKGITQALAGTGFLSETARRNIKDTIEAKYLASKRTYDNLYNQYGVTISTLTGRNDGTKFLKDYSTPASSESAGSNTDPADPLGIR